MRPRYKGSAHVRQTAVAERSLSLKGLYLPGFLSRISLTECEPWLMTRSGVMCVNTDDQVWPPAPPIIDCCGKSPALCWPAALATAWWKQVCEEKSQDRLSPGRRLRQTQMLCSDWSTAGNPGLWLVRTLAWSWPRVTLVHGWEAEACDPRLSHDEMPQIRPEMTHYTHYTPRPLSQKYYTKLCSCMFPGYNLRKNAAQFQIKFKSPLQRYNGRLNF